MISRGYLIRKKQYLSNKIEDSLIKIFDYSLNIFGYNPDENNYYKNDNNNDIIKYAVSRECVWEFVDNASETKTSLINRISKRLYKNFIIYFSLDIDEMILDPVLSNNSTKRNLKPENSKHIFLHQKKSIYSNIVKFEILVVEINKRFYSKSISTIKQKIIGFRKIIKRSFSLAGFNSHFYFLSHKRIAKNEIFNKPYLRKETHYD